MENGKKIVMIGNSYLAIWGLRAELIEKLIEEGYEVWTVFPNGPFGEGERKAQEMKCHFVNSKLVRRGKNLLQEIYLFIQYFKVIKRERPSIVLAYTVKPVIYSGIICGMLNVAFFPNITGLGEALQDNKIILKLYKFATKDAECIFFQNNNDKDFFENNRFRYKNFCMLPGSGVNLEKYSVLKWDENLPVKFTYVARVMKTKGIEEFLIAAERMKELYGDVEFHVCGICEEDYRGMLAEYQEKKIIQYHGLVHDMQPYYKETHCVVMPSYYPEGMSNVLLEAAASGRPIITTNRVGCREAVDDKISGYLVVEKDSNDLFEKMNLFYNLSWEEKKAMGINGRLKVEKKFDRRIVVDNYMNIINECCTKTEMSVM